MSVTRCKPQLVMFGTFNHTISNVYSPKAVEIYIHAQCCGYSFLYGVLNIFSFGFIEALDSKGILNMLIKGITSAMECADVLAFTFTAWQMRLLTLQVYFSRSDCHKFICNSSSISCGIRQLFYRSWLGKLNILKYLLR